jgi:putative ABC transport system ATP-binding protein
VTPDNAMVVVQGLHRTYGSGAQQVHALRGIDLAVPRGQIAAVVGRSGSGKTTLLNCIGGLDRPDDGSVRIDGADVTGMGEDGLLRLRRETVGFVFQSFGLIPILSARENVGIPLRLLSVDATEREDRVGTLLGMVGLSEHAEQRPYELSGGQQQRVAVARALASRPGLLLADEPTGQLDSATGRSVMQLLRAVVRAQDLTALVATHDPALIDLADEVYELHDGTLSPAATAPPAA